jgi:two-component system nitrate/nitrite response regulator NarL
MRPQIKVFVADGQPIFLAGLARIVRLDERLRLVGEADAGAAARAAILRLVPDVAVLDAELGLRVLDAVAQHRLSTRVALLATEVRRDSAFDAVASGASGYLSKRATAEIVRDAIHRIAAGGSVLCEDAQTTVASEIRVRHGSGHALLTARELDVLKLAAAGLSHPEIGRQLHLAPTTVKSYATRAYERLGARDRLGAVVEAMRRGILD